MKRKYNITVDCANCALQIEHAIAKIEGVQAVSINFITQTMAVQYKDDCNVTDIEKQIAKIGRKIDRDFEMEDR